MATIHTFTGNEIIATEVPKYLNDNFSALNSVDEDIKTQLGALAPLASPTLTGTPKAPTASEGTNTTQIATTAFVASAVKVKSVNGKTGDVVVDVLPVGTILLMGGTTVPTGYLACNGAAVSRTTYATLFARIGTTYGSGNGSTTFNLPNSGSNLVSDITTGNVPVFGNGKTVGFQSKNYKLGIAINSNHLTGWSGLYNTNIGTNYSGSYENNTSIGITTEQYKSGIVAKVTATKTTVKYCIKY